MKRGEQMDYQKLDDHLFRLWMAFWTTLWVTAIGVCIQYVLSLLGPTGLEWDETFRFATGVFIGGWVLCGVRQGENR